MSSRIATGWGIPSQFVQTPQALECFAAIPQNHHAVGQVVVLQCGKRQLDIVCAVFNQPDGIQ
jgi:hypothetical protein